MKNNHFNFPRVLQLISNDIWQQKIVVLIVALLIALICTVQLAYKPSNIDASFYFFLLYVIGFIATGSVFNELHDRQKAYKYLLLPASSLEKFLAKWLLTAIIYPLALLFLLYSLSLLNFILNTLLGLPGPSYTYMTIFNGDLWLGICKYIILQAVVLLGAVSFKKYALLKTALVVISFFMLIGALFWVLTWFFMPHFALDESLVRASLQGWHFIFWVLLAPFCWYVTYLKLAEYELR